MNFKMPEESKVEIDLISNNLIENSLKISSEQFEELIKSSLNDVYNLGVFDKKEDVTKRIHKEISYEIYQKIYKELIKRKEEGTLEMAHSFEEDKNEYSIWWMVLSILSWIITTIMLLIQYV